jgi:hypothetical protein
MTQTKARRGRRTEWPSYPVRPARLVALLRAQGRTDDDIAHVFDMRRCAGVGHGHSPEPVPPA